MYSTLDNFTGENKDIIMLTLDKSEVCMKN